ncbi:hypothetical protein [Nocardiopsis sp. NPDC006938]
MWFFLAYDLTDNPWMQIDTEDTDDPEHPEVVEPRRKDEVEC